MNKIIKLRISKLKTRNLLKTALIVVLKILLMYENEKI